MSEPQPPSPDTAASRPPSPVESTVTAGLEPGTTASATPTPLPSSKDVAPQTSLLTPSAEPRPVRPAFVVGLVLATFGCMIPLILPTAFSLSVALARVAPGQEEILGGLTAAGSLAAILTGPAIGVWSDRTRSRLGRRRPFLVGGLVVGILGLLVLGTAGSIALLYVGWIITQLGWGVISAALLNVQADRLPEEQRARVAGLTGFATMIAPILGVGLASFIVSDQFLLFVAPGAVGAVFILAFAILMTDADTRGKRLEPLSFAALASKYVFNPRRHRAYAWNWLGRLVFFMGISASTTYTTYFFAQRLGMAVDEVAGVLAAVSLLGVVSTTIGALGSGFLSDRVKRRRIFIVVGAVAFAAGSLVTGFGHDVAVLATGMFIANLGIGVFSAVDQAIVLDVLPERETDAGRYMALMAFAQSIPSIVAPLVAGVLITLGAVDGQKNYTILFVSTAVFALIGAAIIFSRVKAVR